MAKQKKKEKANKIADKKKTENKTIVNLNEKKSQKKNT